MKPTNYLILSDLDGTLLDLPNGISKEHLNKLNLLIDKGLKFTIATGRDMKKTKKAIKGLKIKYPVILTNGALLADLNKEKYLEITTIPNNIRDKILTTMDAAGISPMVYASYNFKNQELHFLKGKWGKKGIHPLTIEKYKNNLNEPTVSIQFHEKKELLDSFFYKFKENFGNEINLIYIEDVSYKQLNIEGSWYWLEINSSSAGKANMLTKLANRLNIPLENCIVFGDNLNDKEVMEIAGYSIAVSNAPNCVKEVANEIIGPNTDGSVINYLWEHQDKWI